MDTSSLFYTLLHSADYILEMVVAIYFLSTTRLQPDRGRLFMGLFLLFSVMMSAGNIFYVINTTTASGNELSSVFSTVLSFPVFFLLLLYIIECHHPNEYNWLKTLKLLAPWLAVAVPTVIVCLAFGETRIYTVDDYMLNIGKCDVILRTLCVLIYLPYGFWCFLLPFRTNNDMMTRPLTSLMCWCTTLMTITFVGGHGLFNTFFDVSHVILYIAITLMSVYSEIADRLQPELLSTVEPAVPTPEDKAEMSLIAQRLRSYMEDEKPWQNPDLMQADLALALCTNIKYVQNAIRELGYSSYSDMINGARIDYVRQKLDDNVEINLKTLFYEAGFRSRITAWRCFSKYVGCSPKEYSERQTKE